MKPYTLTATHRRDGKEWDVTICHYETVDDALEAIADYEETYKDWKGFVIRYEIRRNQ